MRKIKKSSKIKRFNYWVRGKSLAWHGGISWTGPYGSKSAALRHSLSDDVIHKRRKGWLPPE
jgi:hypothetical protein